MQLSLRPRPCGTRHGGRGHTDGHLPRGGRTVGRRTIGGGTVRGRTLSGRSVGGRTVGVPWFRYVRGRGGAGVRRVRPVAGAGSVGRVRGVGRVGGVRRTEDPGRPLPHRRTRTRRTPLRRTRPRRAPLRRTRPRRAPLRTAPAERLSPERLPSEGPSPDGPVSLPTEALLNPTTPDGAASAAPSATSRFSSRTALRLTCSTRGPGSQPAATSRAAPSGASAVARAAGDGRADGSLARHPATTSRNPPESEPSSGSSWTTL